MAALFFLIFVFYNGYLINRFFLKKEFENIQLEGAFLAGSLISVTFIAVLLLFLHSILICVVIYFILSTFTFLKTVNSSTKTFKKPISIKKLFLLLVLFCVVYFIFQKSFSYDSNLNQFLIQSNLYQDLGVHIPMIRYFSTGKGFIPEVSFFAGKNLFYHFMFDFYAGILEFLGLRIDIAFNLISSLSYTLLLLMIFKFSSRLFNNKLIGLFSCAFFILNSDLSFIDVLLRNSFSPFAIYHNNTYLIQDKGGIMIGHIFLNMNVFLNQRHLIFGLLWIIYLLYLIIFSNKNMFSTTKVYFITAMIALFPFWHVSMLLSAYLLLFALWLVFSEKRASILKVILFSLIFVLPQIMLIKLNSDNHIIFRPGFLVADDFSLLKFLTLWIWNLGFALPVIILGFVVSNKLQRSVFAVFAILFILANLFQFTPDIFDNHKFFNVWIISINMMTAAGIVFLLNKNNIFKFAAAVLIILITLSGIFDFLVIKNDVYAKVTDYSKTKFGKWISGNIPSSEILMTNAAIYDPASIMGRRTFLGRSHFIYSYGADPSERLREENTVFTGKNDAEIKSILIKEKINYLIIYKNIQVPGITKLDSKYFKNSFKQIYEDNFAVIYKV